MLQIWGQKGLRKYESCAFIICARERKVFHYREGLVHKHKAFMQNRTREVEVKTAYTITQPERVVIPSSSCPLMVTFEYR